MIWVGEIPHRYVGAADLLIGTDLGTSNTPLQKRHLDVVGSSSALSHERSAVGSNKSAAPVSVLDGDLVA